MKYLNIFLTFFPPKIGLGTSNLHEMPKPIFWIKKNEQNIINLLSAELAQRVVDVSSYTDLDPVRMLLFFHDVSRNYRNPFNLFSRPTFSSVSRATIIDTFPDLFCVYGTDQSQSLVLFRIVKYQKKPGKKFHLQGIYKSLQQV